jgi:hypothetical protein
MQGVWLAATDEKQEGKFIWENSQTELVYSNFRQGEPNNREILDKFLGKYNTKFMKKHVF